MMDFLINIDLKKLSPPISYENKLMLMGSCFTEHIGNSLSELKFSVLQNPNGILFGPDSICKALLTYVENRVYTEKNLFLRDELYNSWDHHSRFSSTEATKTLAQINQSISTAHDYLAKADWLIITLGSAFTYRLTSIAEPASSKAGDAVANCHRAPANWFEKRLLPVAEIETMFHHSISEIRNYNPKIKILFTISPVRHIRDGVVENNRSKARLITAVHEIAEKLPGVFYFPAYELVIDVLRDYRFYDIDLVHPNYAATDFVMSKFIGSCVDPSTALLMEEVRKLVTARKHRPFQADTLAHKQFLSVHREKTLLLKKAHPYLDLERELEHFTKTKEN